MTAKVKKSPRHRCDTVPDTIKALIWPKIKVRAQYNTPSLASKKGTISRVDINHLTWPLEGVSGQSVRTSFAGKKGEAPLPVG